MCSPPTPAVLPFPHSPRVCEADGGPSTGRGSSSAQLRRGVETRFAGLGLAALVAIEARHGIRFLESGEFGDREGKASASGGAWSDRLGLPRDVFSAKIL